MCKIVEVLVITQWTKVGQNRIIAAQKENLSWMKLAQNYFVNSSIIIVATKHPYCKLFVESSSLTGRGPKHWDEILKEFLSWCHLHSKSGKPRPSLKWPDSSEGCREEGKWREKVRAYSPTATVAENRSSFSGVQTGSGVESWRRETTGELTT